MNNLITTHKFDQCEICAYHESGHVIFSYLCGYSCREVQLIDQENESGFTSYALIDYRNDAYYASKLTSAEKNISFFKSLPLGEKLEAVEVGRRLVRIYLGGSAAAAVFNNAGSNRVAFPVQMDYTDLVRTEYIHYVISGLSTGKDPHFMEHGLKEALYTLGDGKIWSTVTDLATRLLQMRRLEKNDIEECLEENGIQSIVHTPSQPAGR